MSYDHHICQIERFEIHRLPTVSVQILANALAEATPTPIAHEEPPCPGLEQASSPLHANHLARTPSGTLSGILSLCPTPIPQAFLGTLWKISRTMQTLKRYPAPARRYSGDTAVPPNIYF